MLTGLLLVIGTIVMVIGWIVVYPASPTDSTAQQAADLMADPSISKLGMAMGFGGMIAMIMGLLHLARGMANAGSSYATLASYLIMPVLTLMVVGLGLEWAVAESSSDSAALALMAISLSFNTGIMLIGGAAFLLLGLGILISKNLNPIGAAGLILTGVLFILTMTVSPGLEDYSWPLFFLTTLLLGILSIKKSN